MTTQARVVSHRHRRARRRSTAFVLAVTAFVAIKLVAVGAVSASRADIDGMEMFDLDCAEESTSLAC